MGRWNTARTLALLLILAGVAAGDPDQDFAEALRRAVAFYSSGDYDRAVAEYRAALKVRDDDFPCRLGLAYSLLFTNQPSSLVEAEAVFNAISERRDPKEEVKRVYGLGLVDRTLGVLYERRAKIRRAKGEAKGAAEDHATSREYARKALVWFEGVVEIEAGLAKARQAKGGEPDGPPHPSLGPSAHVGIAHCEILLADPEEPDGVEGHLQRARESLEAYAAAAAKAREAWKLRHEALLAIDPMKDPDPKERYEEFIATTIRTEVAVRRALFLTLAASSRFREAIEEANAILSLDPGLDDVLRDRARAYLFLDPPDRRAALKDIEEYCRRLTPSGSKDDLAQLDRDIARLKKEIEDEKPPGAQ